MPWRTRSRGLFWLDPTAWYHIEFGPVSLEIPIGTDASSNNRCLVGFHFLRLVFHTLYDSDFPIHLAIPRLAKDMGSRTPVELFLAGVRAGGLCFAILEATDQAG